jgi:hypothetical protein
MLKSKRNQKQQNNCSQLLILNLFLIKAQNYNKDLKLKLLILVMHAGNIIILLLKFKPDNTEGLKF